MALWAWQCMLVVLFPRLDVSARPEQAALYSKWSHPLERFSPSVILVQNCSCFVCDLSYYYSSLLSTLILSPLFRIYTPILFRLLLYFYSSTHLPQSPRETRDISLLIYSRRLSTKTVLTKLLPFFEPSHSSTLLRIRYLNKHISVNTTTKPVG